MSDSEEPDAGPSGSDDDGPYCWVCQGARSLVASSRDESVLELSHAVTYHKLMSLLADGRMTYVRCDAPLEEMGALIASGLRERAAALLRCESCGREWLWACGYQIETAYREVPPGAPEQWDWKPVPDAALWKTGPIRPHVEHQKPMVEEE